MKLHKYQEDYLSTMPKNGIMWADVGTGKTIMALDHYKRYGEKRPLLILAPAAKVKTKDWHREMDNYLGSKMPKDYWVVSYDKFARKPEAYLGLEKLCVIADECHFICNSQTKRSKGVRKVVTQADQFIGLSATPLPNGWSSIENFAILFGLVRNKTEFMHRFVRIDRTRGFPIILGYNEENVLKKFWNSVSRFLDRDGKIDLPEVVSIPIVIEMTDAEKAAYNKAKRTRIAPDGTLLDSPPKLFAHLRQSMTPLRVDALQAILDSTNEHIVIFYNYNIERDMILKVLNSLPKGEKRVIYEQSGHASNLPDRKIWETMKPSVTLAQYQSASTAIELTYAPVTIFLSPTYSYANFHQARGRTHRQGQKKRVVFYLMSVRFSIDTAVYNALRKKSNFNETVWLEETEVGME
jgi:superfamily II DNA or RNA helicase